MERALTDPKSGKGILIPCVPAAAPISRDCGQIPFSHGIGPVPPAPGYSGLAAAAAPACSSAHALRGTSSQFEVIQYWEAG